jgi:glutamate N-acetyltransferase/amino-acid acetyltransferase
MCALVEKYTGIKSSNVIVASTGVIGKPLDIEPIGRGLPTLVKTLGPFSEAANEAIMTTDTVKKSLAISFEIGGKECRIGGIAKGSGMIHPNMATMLAFVTTDVKISPEMLQKAISEDVKSTFNMVSVDRDTSTNDMLSVMANGLAGNEEITEYGEDFDIFLKALHSVTAGLSKMIANDGEGASKLIIAEVWGAAAIEDARKAAKSVITSNLLKAAMFGSDANWGRVLCALGYSGANIDVNKIGVFFASAKGKIEVCKSGAGVSFSEDEAKIILSEKEITIVIDLNQGPFSATAWGCDLTYDYVRINGDYRT